MKVEIEKFQSIRKASLEVKGFTVIVGDTNIGKSAIMRAIYAALRAVRGTNFVRLGEDFSRVTIEDEGIHVVWEKGEDTNRYFINHDEIPDDKVGNEVPEAVVKAGFFDVALREGKVKLSPQHASQKDGSYFLLDKSPAIVAEVLAQLSRLDVMIRATRKAESDIKGLKSEIKTREKDREVLKEKLTKFQRLQAAKDIVLRLRKESVELKARQDLLSKVKTLAAEISTQKKILVATSRPASLPLLFPKEMLGVLRSVTDIAPSYARNLRVVGATSRSVSIPQLPPPSPLQNVSRVGTAYLQSQRVVRASSRPVPNLREVSDPKTLKKAADLHRGISLYRKFLSDPSPTLPSLPSVEGVREMGKRSESLKNARAALALVATEHAQLEKSVQTSLGEIHSIEKELGTCPLCERQFAHG